MQKKRKDLKITNIGSSMLLIIFLILCLFIFATLSLSAARSNYLLSRQNADRQTAHYASSNASQEILAVLPTVTAQSGETRIAATSAGEITIHAAAAQNGHTVLSWQIPVTDTQSLAVSLDMADSADGEDFTITQWQIVSTREWTGTQTIPVLLPASSAETN